MSSHYTNQVTAINNNNLNHYNRILEQPTLNIIDYDNMIITKRPVKVV
jgi:hypothetical protein